MQKITPCLWFDDQAEQAVHFYTSIFKNSRIGAVSRYNEAFPDKAGQVLTIEFSLDGVEFTALNGGPEFTFSHAISFSVQCADQAEVDHYWERLSEGGEIEMCGWLKDRFGVSWQIVPTVLGELMSDPDPEKVSRVTKAMLEMKKLDIEGLKRAAGEA